MSRTLRRRLASVLAVFMLFGGVAACSDEDDDGANTDEEVDEIEDQVDEGADEIQEEIEEGENEVEGGDDG